LVRVISGESSCQEDSSFKKIDQEESGIKKIGMLVDPSTEMTEMLVGSGTKMTEMLLDSGIKKTVILNLLYYIIKSLDMGIPDSVMYSSVEIFFPRRHFHTDNNGGRWQRSFHSQRPYPAEVNNRFHSHKDVHEDFNE
jgi:hypothetical protein